MNFEDYESMNEDKKTVFWWNCLQPQFSYIVYLFGWITDEHAITKLISVKDKGCLLQLMKQYPIVHKFFKIEIKTAL